MKDIKVYTDGSARLCTSKNGGIGIVIKYIDDTNEDDDIKIVEISKGFENTTNNRMEIIAVITGLEYVDENSKIDVFSDSRYVVNAFNEHWIESWINNEWRKADGYAVKNSDLWKRLLDVVNRHQIVNFNWVKGHAGHPENERCDELASIASTELHDTRINIITPE